MWFAFLAVLLSVPKPAAPVFEYGMVGGAKSVPTLTIMADGRWQGVGVEGALSEAEHKRLMDAIGATRFELGPPPGVPCPARPPQESVVTPKGSLVFARSCGRVADPSVLALIELAESLTTRRPPDVFLRLQRERVGAGFAEAAHVMRDGRWTTHVGRGQLDKETLAGLIAAFDAALLEAPPTPEAPNCRGDFPHHLEVPGRGEVRWIWPCSKPSPSLDAALTKLFAAVGLKAP